MKTLHIINSLGIGGAEKLVVLLVPEMRRQGVTADILIIDKHRTIFHDQLERQGVTEIHTLGLNNFYNPLAILKLGYTLMTRFRHYDVLHSHLFPTLYWLAIAGTLTRPRTPLVTTEHNTTNRRRNINFFKFLDKYIYRRYSAIVTVSPIATEFLQGYVKANEISFSTITNAIDQSVFQNAPQADLFEETGAPMGSKFAIQVSTFTPQKDHDTLINAIPGCEESLHLILVGEGAKKNEIKALAEKLGVGHRVHFLGIRNDVPSLLKAADIAVLSSHYEGLSLSVLEAFASETAFVGSDSPGLGDITRAGGLVVGHEDVDEMTNTLNQLVSNSALRERTAKRGLTHVQQYTIDKTASRYIELYRQLGN